jgi:hypothetical protein
MTTILCTLYNSLYLDKGLVLYDSLCECAKDFKLYVLCMDDKCYKVLSDLNLECCVPIRLSDFESGDDELLEAKSNRPMGEYCWTCSSSFIRFVLQKCNEQICTYIDADMYFYSDPQILLDEMLAEGKDVMVTPHRFPIQNILLADTMGMYCVEFNTFVNTPKGIEVLEFWRDRCLECCSNLEDGIHWGDQKYLDEIVEKFDCVHVCQNRGAGVAPWNVILYKKEDRPFVFYHFQSIRYLTRIKVDTGLLTEKGMDKELVYSLYYSYLTRIEVKKKYLEQNYGISFLIRHHPTEKDRSILSFLWSIINPRELLYNMKLYLNNIHPLIVEIG